MHDPESIHILEKEQLLLRKKSSPSFEIDTNPDIEASASPDYKKLSYAQQRIWFLHLLGRTTEYQVCEALHLQGELDIQALEETINVIVERHEILRTRFVAVRGETIPLISPRLHISLPIEDVTTLDITYRKVHVSAELQRELERPFDLSQAPLFRIKLIKLDEQEHVLLRTFHYMVFDGTSHHVLNEEFASLYAAFRRKLPNPLRPLTSQYADFVRWEREHLKNTILKGHLEYWKRYLDGIPEELALPKDRPRDEGHTTEAGIHTALLSAGQTEALKQYCTSQSVSLYAALFSVLAVLLSRYTGQHDMVIGCPVETRPEPRMKSIIGFFLNLIALRVQITPHHTFHDLVRAVTSDVEEAAKHQSLPFEQLVAELVPQRNPHKDPLFQVEFVLENTAPGSQVLEGLEIEPVTCELRRTGFDLEVTVWERQGRIELQWVYNRHLFDSWRVAQMARHYIALLQSAITDPNIPIELLNILSTEEIHGLLSGAGSIEKPPIPELVHELFENQAKRNPKAIALAVDGESISYCVLNERANRLARYLLDMGAGPESMIGIFLSRSVELVISILGVLKAGAACLFLDPGSPAARVSQVVSEAAPLLVLSRTEFRASFSGVRIANLNEAQIESEFAQCSTSNIQPHERSTALLSLHPAYLIYTSGSTGKPNGVLMTHLGLTNKITTLNEYLGVGSDTRYAVATTVGFDPILEQILCPLCAGGTCILVPDALRTDAQSFWKYIAHHNVSILDLTPKFMESLAPDGKIPVPLDTLIMGGDVLPTELANKLRSNSAIQRMLNLYGPTEACIDATSYEITCPLAGPVPIGQALPNYRIYLLDSSWQLIPQGAIGEIYIAGPGLARGYLHRPDITAERFVPDPYCKEPGSRMYRTGDLAFARRDGSLQFAGRTDHQIKIRGFRVEPEEIASMLKAHPLVQDALVLTHARNGESQLLAYVVPKESSANDDVMRSSHIFHWQKIHESSYWHGSESSGDFNIAGWNSSYTGEPIAPEEMRIWVNETVARIRRLRPRKVLEVGCGTGLLLTRLATDCESYIGVDFSAQTLAQLGAYLKQRDDLEHVVLRQGIAHDLSFAQDDSVDLVILNSVLMYFPNTDYLLDFLAEACRVTKTGGHIFVGDVRSLSLLDAYHASVQLYKAAGNISIHELRERFIQAYYNEEELAIDPAFFTEILLHKHKFGRAEIALKSGNYDNELSRFRYDVTLTLGTKQRVAEPELWLQCDHEKQWQRTLRAILAQRPACSAGLRNILDLRTATAIEAACRLRHRDGATFNVDQLRSAILRTDGEDPNDIMEFAHQLGTEIHWRPTASAGIYDVIFNPQWIAESLMQEDFPRKHYRRFGNSPGYSSQSEKTAATVRDYLRQQLPDFMVPAAILTVPRWPLNINGKVDRSALPQPRVHKGVSYRAPHTPQEKLLCEIFAEVLSLDQVGIDDNFFELGGHSLMAMRLVAKIQALTGIDVPIHAVFEAPTASRLTAYLAPDEGNRPPLRRYPRPERLPLSHSQKGLWFIHQLHGASTQYNWPEAWHLTGMLDRSSLERALQAIVDRHESLRTAFVEFESEPVQTVVPHLTLSFPFEDLSRESKTRCQERVLEILRQEWEEPFDLSRAPLLRMKLVRHSPQEHVLFRTVHHIVWDGWSQEVFSRELAELYNSFCERRDNPLEPLPVQYADFTLWQQAPANREIQARALAYWKQQLSKLPDYLDLPSDRSRGPRQTFSAGIYHCSLPKDELLALRRTSDSNQCTLYTTLLSTFALLLWRYTGQKDIIIGTPFANRSKAQLEQLIGFFVNPTVMRIQLDPAQKFRDLLGRTRATVLEAHQYQELPFESLVEALAPARSSNHTPIFQVVLAMLSTSPQLHGLAGLNVTSISGDKHKARFDLELQVLEMRDEIHFEWIYNKDLFDLWRVEQMASHLRILLGEIAACVDISLFAMQILSIEERRSFIEEMNVNESLILPQTVPELLEFQVSRCPNKDALVFGSSAMSYAELNERANRLAHYLISEGAGPESLVGICMERRPEMIVAILAALKAGAAYIPLDPSHPMERLSRILREAGPCAIFTTPVSRSALPPDQPDVLVIDDMLAKLPLNLSNPTNNERTVPLVPEHPAYVIYTSGTTGSPKGIVVTHSGVAALVHTQQERLGVNPRSRVLQFASLSFDASFWEIVMALATGATLVLRTDEEWGGRALQNLLTIQHVTHATLPPSVLETLEDDSMPDLESLIVAGESCPASLVSWSQNRRMFNAYGPTETTVCATISKPLSTGGSPAIGQPVAGASVYVLDKSLNLVPMGVPGELHVAGPALARGYLNSPDLTAEKFIPDPFGPSGSRMYCTGDLVRWQHGGELEFLGRIDQQLKIRGFRVEPGEIETLLAQHPMVASAVVIAREDQFHEKCLVAYVVAVPGQIADSEILKQFLLHKLPGYMVPSAVMVLPSLPLGPTGKIDRNALPIPEMTGIAINQPPQTPAEEMLCLIFAEVLQREAVGRNDDFFALGGHSLLLMRLATRIRIAAGVELSIRTLFEFPTVAALALHLPPAKASNPGLVIEPRPDVLPASYGQQRLWFLSRLHGDSAEYNVPQALRLRGHLDQVALLKAVNFIVGRHEVLRTRFVEQAGELTQVIDPQLAIDLQVEDCTALSRAEQEEHTALAMQTEWHQSFDLEHGPLLRMKLLRMGEQEHILLLTSHHIVFDGWSQSVFNRELTELYQMLLAGKECCLPLLPVQYADFVIWQRRQLKQETLDSLLAYWKKELAGIPEEVDLPKDYLRGQRQTFRAEICRFVVPENLSSTLYRFSLSNHATLYMTVLAAFSVLLHRYSGQNDMAIGSPITSVPDPLFEPLIGLFVNSLVMRVRIQPGCTFRELLLAVKAMTLNSYDHQLLPFELLVDELAPKRDLNLTPIYQVTLTMNNTPAVPLRLGALEVEPVLEEEIKVRTDLELHIWERGHEIEYEFVYNRNLFDRQRMEQMARHFIHLLDAAITAPDTSLQDLDMLNPEERHVLTSDSSNGYALPEFTIPALFELQATQRPQSIAAVHGTESLTYGELHRRSNQLAHCLVDLGVGAGSMIGICMERSFDMLVALLATVKIGAIYLPLDVNYPAERLSMMMEDSDVTVLLVQSATRDILPVTWAQVIAIDTEWEEIQSRPVESPLGAVYPVSPAYAMYTSGSTGEPKGILIPHLGIIRLVVNTDYISLQPGDRIAQIANISFDASTFEIWGALLNGAVLVIMPRETTLSPAAFARTLREHDINVLFLTTALFNQIAAEVPEAFRGVRDLLFGGEAVNLERTRSTLELGRPKRLLHVYGPTENTTFSTWKMVEHIPELAPTVPIGTSIAHTGTYVLNANLDLTPLGIVGELYLSGAGLAHGYLKRPGLTAERFIPDPFGEPGTRMYRTGDLVRRNFRFEIEFVGRADQQVKIRGYRIELGEIESVLKGHSSVLDATVMMREDLPGEKRLAAYIVPSAAVGFTADEIRHHLAQKLPDYMVPTAIMMLESMPLSANGKIDRKALPPPDLASKEAYVAPRNEAEQILCKVWSDVLGVQRVGVDDNFFELGGDSILSIRIIADAQREGLHFTIREIFEQQTVAGIVHALPGAVIQESLPAGLFNLVSDEDRERLPQDVEDAYPLSRLQAGMLFHSEYNQGPAVYHVVLSYHLQAPLDVNLLQTAIQIVAAPHAVLRTSFDLQTYSEPLQLVHRTAQIPFTAEDLSALDEDAQEKALKNWMEWEQHRTFAFDHAPLLRFCVHRRSARNFQFSMTFHHAILDGWSDAMLIRELLECYFSLLRGQQWAPVPRFSHFRDFIKLELHTRQMPEARDYWVEQLRESELTRFPWSAQPSAKVTTLTLRVRIDNTLSDRLRNVAVQLGTSIKNVILAAHLRVVGLLSGQQDVITGLVTNGRPETKDGDRAMGLFLNTLPFRMRLDQSCWKDLIRAIAATELAMLPYRRYPLLDLQLITGRTELFQTAFNFTHFHVLSAIEEIGGFKILDYKSFGQTNFALLADCSVDAVSSMVQLWLSFNALVIEEGQINIIHDYYLRILEAIAHEPASSCDASALLASEDILRQMELSHGAELRVPDVCLHQLFEQQAARTPEGVALRYCEEVITFAALNCRANQLAYYLQKKGIGPESRVGLSMERSIELVIGILATLKCGAAYVPLDVTYPAERLQYMAENASLQILLTCSPHKEKFASYTGNVMDVQQQSERLRQESTENLNVPMLLDNLAYVIYTSGSTGRPKGVMGVHRGAVNRLAWMWAMYPFDEGEVCCQKTAISFVDSLAELFGPLLHGVEVVIIPEDVSKNPIGLLRIMNANLVTRIVLVPSLLQAMVEAHTESPVPMSHLKYCMSSGEALTGNLSNFFQLMAPHTKLLNLYGSSEVSADVTWAEIGNCHGLTVPIGRPMANTQVYVLDKNLHLLPAGVVGEIYAAGSGLARGYWQQPDLTAEQFLPNPFGKPGSLMYRTGDLGRWTEAGLLVFVGRADHQVKIRGIRIEPAEIEAALKSDPSVSESVVVAQEDEGKKKLVAYVVPQPGVDLNTSNLRLAVAERIPGFMVPYAFVVLDRLPLTPNGKVDRKALPVPARLTRNYVAPSTPQEHMLCSIFADVLGIESVGINDNFFELGGHSLVAARLIHHIASVANTPLTLDSIFHAPTVAELSHKIGPQIVEAAGTNKLLPLRKSGKLPPLFCLPPVGGLCWSYAALASKLSPNRPIYGIQLAGLNNSDPLPSSIEEIAESCLAAMRSAQPHGPYHLLGWSFGGLVAYALACSLAQKNEEIGLLALLDSYPATDGSEPHLFTANPTDLELAQVLRLDISSLNEQCVAVPDIINAARKNNHVLGLLEDTQAMRLLELMRRHIQLIPGFRPGRFAGDLLLFTALKNPVEGFSASAWSPFVSGTISTHAVACEHLEMMDPAPCARIASVLEQALMPAGKLF